LAPLISPGEADALDRRRHHRLGRWFNGIASPTTGRLGDALDRQDVGLPPVILTEVRQGSGLTVISSARAMSWLPRRDLHPQEARHLFTARRTIPFGWSIDAAKGWVDRTAAL
jgi:hypothetical protein